MKLCTKILGTACLACFLALADSAAAGTGPEKWTGGAQKCITGDSNWSTGGNWDSGSSPADNDDVEISAIWVCDPCLFHQCSLNECLSGPHEGESCSEPADCACDGGSFTAVFDYGIGTTKTFGQVEVKADSSNDMTLRKTGVGTFRATTGLWVTGNSTKKAILDIDAQDAEPSDLTASGTAEIDVASTKTLEVLDQFRVAAFSTDTLVTLKGSGTVDVGVAGHTTTISSGTSKTATLKVEDILLKVGDLEIFGGTGTSELAKFYFPSGNATVDNLKDVTMRGESEILVEDASDLEATNDLTVDTDGENTEAEISLLSGWTFLCVDVFVTAGSTESSTLTITGGTFDSSGTVMLDGTSSSYKATLKIEDTADEPDLTHVIIKDWGVLDIEKNATLSGTLTIPANNDEAKVVSTGGFDVTANKIVINTGVTFDPTGLDTGSVIQVQ